MIKNLLKSFIADVTGASDRRAQFENKQVARAAIGCAMYIGKSGGMSDTEFDSMCTQLNANPRFAKMDIDAIIGDWEAYRSDRLFKRDLMNLLTTLRGEASKDEREDIIITAIEVADAEGQEGDDSNIDDEELRLLEEISETLGVNLKSLM